MPFESNSQFVGRNSELDVLERKLADHQSSKVAITGLGGIGKTQVALELAYRIKDKDAKCSIFWVPATNMESLHQAYREIACQLQIPGLEQENVDVKKLVQLHLIQESAGRWLLIFDNADDITMWINDTRNNDASPSLIDYLPYSKQGSLVFTTRTRKVAVKLAQQNVVDVSKMDEDLAAQMLSKYLIDRNLLENRKDAVELLKQLDFLPLAIVQAAAYINANRTCTILDYLSLLQDQEQTIIELLSEDFEDNWRYRNIKNSVATTWLISFEQIRQRDRLAAEYLSFMSCIDPRDIPQSLLPRARSRKEEVDALGTLSAYSFVTRRKLSQSLDLHRLVHLATRNWLRKEGLLVKWTFNAIAQLAEIFPSNDNKNRTQWKAYLPHAHYVLKISFTMNKTKETMKLLSKFGQCLHSDGRYNEAREIFVQLTEMTSSVLGTEHLDTLSSAAWLASTYQSQGRWKEAEELNVKVMEIKQRVLGEEHPGMLTSMSNLALIYQSQGRWKKAEKLEIQVIEIKKRVLGKEHPDILMSMGNLASIYQNQGRWKEAKELEMQVIETRKRVLGKEYLYTLTSMANLALIYQNQGGWKEAEKLNVQVMKIKQRVLGEEYPGTLISIDNLASTYQD